MSNNVTVNSNDKTGTFAAAMAPVNIDILYSGLSRLPNMGEEVFSKQFEIQLGGGPVATIVALSRLGINCTLGTFLSNDFMSFFARRELEQNGVIYKNLYRGEKVPVIVTSIASFIGDRCFITHCPEHSEFKTDENDIYNLFSGSKVCRGFDGHNDIIRRLKDEGTQIAYDVSWEDDLNINKFKDILRFVDVFTPNEKEAIKMTGTSSAESALEAISRYVKNTIVKTGKDGCITKIGNSIVHVPVPDVFNAIDTTGAGDNFLAGVMFGMLNDWGIVECMKMGNIAGGYSTTELGCSKALLTLDKAMKYMKLYDR